MFFEKFCGNWRIAALRQISEVKGLLTLLMRPRNTGRRWTADEKKQIVEHLKAVSKTLPMLVLFSLPGGSLFLPVFAFLLDRRRIRREGGDNRRI
jgi:hypothetical protein